MDYEVKGWICALGHVQEERFRACPARYDITHDFSYGRYTSEVECNQALFPIETFPEIASAYLVGGREAAEAVWEAMGQRKIPRRVY